MACANWTFIVWGVMHGVFQIVEKALGWQKYEGKNWSVKIIRMLATFLLVNFAWLFFRMPDISSAWAIIIKIFTSFGTPDLSDLDVFMRLILLLGVSILFFKDFKDEFFPRRMAFLNNGIIRWSIYIILFVMILTLGVLDGGQFIYVSF